MGQFALEFLPLGINSLKTIALSDHLSWNICLFWDIFLRTVVSRGKLSTIDLL